MLVRLGKFLLILIFMCIFAVILYFSFQSIFGKDTYDGTFVFNEKVGPNYGYIY